LNLGNGDANAPYLEGVVLTSIIIKQIQRLNVVYIRVVGWLFDYFNNLQLQLFEFLKKKIKQPLVLGFFGIRKNFGFGPLKNLE